MEDLSLDAIKQELLGLLAEEDAALPAADEAGPVPVAREDAMPLSFAQRRLWFLDQLDHEAGAAYHVRVALRLSGALNVDALRRALARIVERHEVLRTRFETVDGEPVQRIAAHLPFVLTTRDLSDLADPDADAQRLAQAQAAEPFDLAAGPLVRGALLKLADREHVLLATMHHIISDDWSLAVLIGELRVLYQAFSQGHADPLPPLALQYADYAVWQRRWLSGDGDVLHRQQSYWKSTLQGAPELTELPLDRARPAVQDYAGDTLDVTLDAGLSAQIKALAQRHGTTMFNVVLAAWAALAGRLSGQDDVVIGTPVANRMRTEVEPLIGFFVNTLALRIDLSGRPGVGELVRRVHRSTLAAQSHQDIPFEQVIEAVNPPRSMAHTPLFQLMLVWQNNEQAGLALGDVELQGMPVEQARAQFDANLELREDHGCIKGTLTFATALFDRASMARYLGYFTTLLAGMVRDDAACIGEFELLSDAERDRLLVQWNDTARAVPQASLAELFDAQAARTPDAIAAVHGEATITYAALGRRANRLAHHLRALGVVEGSRVGMCVDRGIDAITTVLAIVKAGAAYVPLDPSHPPQRLALMLDDSDVAQVVAQASLAERLTEAAFAGQVIELDGPRAQWTAQSELPLSVNGDRRSLAYIIYTSGSTGRPKGVMVEHGSVIDLVVNTNYVELGAAHVIAQVSNLAFDAATFEIWGALLSGARLVCIGKETALDPSTLLRAFEHHGVNVMFLTTALFNQLSAHDSRAFGRFVYLLVGGEQVDPVSLARVLDAARPRRLFNAYGPTETTTFATWYDIDSVPAGRSVPIGKPLANMRAYVLDARLQPAPIGVAGDLYIGGSGVARGYLNQPALTAERFIVDPYSNDPHARLYKTGDRARWLPQGDLQYLGRIDHQIKLRGFRIELGEVETALRGLPQVSDAVVVMREDQPGDKRLVGYLVAANGYDAASLPALKDALSTTLPDYMVPTQVMWLDALPLTPNGKLDRRALPVPEAVSSDVEYVAPRAGTEQALAEIWAQVLKVDRVGVHDNFFELGGHSLLAVQLASRVRGQLGVEVALAELFAHPVLGQFAQVVERAGASALPAIQVRDRSNAAALSFSQQRLWFLDQMDRSADTAYHVMVGLNLRGALDVAALQMALDRIVERHEVLRTRFEVVDGEPVQRVDAHARFALALHDLATFDEPQAEARRHAQEEAGEPFDLSTGPLVRGRLLRLGDHEHVLLATMHHIVSDGWSMGVLVREFSALYGAFSQGQDDPLAPLAIQYADYAMWQRGWMTDAVLARQLAYWRDALHGAPELLTLPTDRPRPAVQRHRGAVVPVSWPADLSRDLKALSQRAGASLFMTLTAALGVVLGRHAGQTDVCIGLPIANRHHAEIEPLIGFFVNTLTLRVRAEPSRPFDEVLAQVRSDALSAYTFQDLPFEQVVDALNPGRTTSHAPIYQVSFNMQNAPSDTLELPGLTIGMMDTHSATVKLDLSVHLQEIDGRIMGAVEYDTDLFDEATVARLFEHYEVLLRAAVDAPHTPVGRLGLLPAHERQQMLVEWNGTASVRGPAQNVHGLFEAQAARTPDAVAVRFGEQQLSYAQLDAQANQMAHRLLAMGVQAETPVAICLDRSIELVVAVLAVLKAGGAYAPLDPSQPAERLAWIVEDAALPLIITTSALADHVPGLMFRLLVDEQERVLAAQPQTRPELDVHAAQLAYVIYTSGSTGQPKGAQLTHEGLLNLAHAQSVLFGVQPGERVLQFAAFGFDASTWEIFMALGSGATLCLAHRDDLMPGLTLEATVARMGVQIATLPPVVLAASAPEAMPSLHTIISAGEACSQELVARWSTGRRFFNAYGPTEVTVCATAYEVRGSLLQAPPIGSPVSNSQAYVLDASLEPAPLGVAGELFIAGAGLARGYRGRADLTAERFVPNPFGEPGSRMYRTGDLVRWLPAGDLEYLGRIDHQIKLRGFRVELGEIEAALRALPQVRDAAVLMHEDTSGEKRLVGYVVPVDDHPQTGADALKAALSRTLPDYMVPSRMMWLAALPLTPNGKVDRRALPVPDVLSSEADYVAPHTEMEQALSEIWAQVLKVERVGIHDNFFELGGHSLLAVQLASSIRSRLGVSVALAGLFAHPTLGQFAQVVESASVSELPPIDVREPGSAAPLSFAQQRLWFLDQLDRRAGAAYQIPLGVRLSGELNIDALQKALDRIVERHEVLRTRFERVDGEPVQRIDSYARFALTVHDLSAAADPEARVQQHAQEEAGEPLDLSTGPLVRARLLRLHANEKNQEHVLLVTMHHIVSDGWSMGVLIREFGALYQAFSDGQDDPLPPLPIQYADYAVWQRRWLSGDVLQKQLSYWKTTLHGAPELSELPLDRVRPAVQDYAGDSLDVTLDPQVSAKLKALAQQQGTTVFNVVLAAWAALTGRLSGQDDVVIGTPVANRMRTEVEPLIGFFVNTLALRIDLSGRPDVNGLITRVHEATLAAQSHQDIPFDQVIEAVNPLRSMAHAPLFQSMLVWQNNAQPELELGDVKLQGMAAARDHAQFDVTLELGEYGDDIAGSLSFATALFDRASIERYLGHFTALLAAMVEDASRPVQQLEILSAAERRQIVHGWNDTADARDRSQTAHGMFEAQVKRTPDAIAVMFEDDTLTYAQLNARANRLARYLVARGVGAEVPVALCLSHSVDMMVAILGVLKAGGAYVPLDPQLPGERLSRMLQDCTPAAVLADQATLSRLPQGAVPLSGAGAPDLDGMPDSDLSLPTHPAQLAYCIYTSGSTGQPKGVQLAHSGLVNLIHAQTPLFGAKPGERALLFARFSFDTSVTDIFMALTAGAALCLAPRDKLMPRGTLEATVARMGVQIATLPPAVLASMEADALPSVHTLVTAGEACTQALAMRWAKGRRFFNAYGPTEATVCSSVHQISSGLDRNPPIGHALANVQLHVLDVEGQLVPVGVAGELFIAGDGVARGYRGRADLTAERFVPNPFGEPGSRMYRTGDLVRRLPDGALEYLGRIDHQVKLRGFRIELGEIEASLRALPAVRDAAVIVNEDAGGNKRLVGYVVATGGQRETSAQVLRDALSKTLPDYMVPSQFMWLAALPLTPNGKLDRRALPVPDAIASSVEYVAPRTEMELALSEIWAEVLKVERVGVHDNFFELGGHSLLAVQLASSIRSRLGVEVALAELFAHPALGQFALAVAQAGVSELPPIEVRAPGVDAPLSFSQQRLWFLDQLDRRAGAAYHIPVGVRLSGALDVEALQKALDRIVGRHAVLRTSFVMENGEPVQRVGSHARFALAMHDLGSSADPEALVQQHAQEEAGEPFDLSAGPLVRGRLLRLGEHDHVLLVTMHHIVSDGWSMGVLIREFGVLYQAYSQGFADPLPLLPVQYADYAMWQRRWLSGDVLQKQLSYWKTTLQGAPELTTLPADHARPAVQDYTGDSLDLKLDAQVSAKIKALAQQQGTTVFNVVLAAWAALAGRLSGQHDVVIGTPVANRMRSEVEPLIGFFVNTLALRIDLSGRPDVGGLIRRVHEATLAAQSHQDIPFDQVIEAVNPLRSMAHAPLFQLLLVWQNNAQAELELGDVKLQGMPAAQAPAQFDVTLELGEYGEHIAGSVTFATSLFDRASMSRYLGYFSTLLEKMVDNATQPVQQIKMLPEAERQQVMHGWNDTAMRYERSTGVHGVFEAQAARTPDAVAVMFGDEALTYAQLDARANQLAHHLVERGVGPDVMVGICMHRGIDLLAALLGVMKAGGGYLPLDPAFPAERLAMMLEDAQPALVLTHEDLLVDNALLTDNGLLSDNALQTNNGKPKRLNLNHWPTGPQHAVSAPRPDGDQIAYVLYTSGSTGRPKGVQVTQHGMLNILTSLQRDLKLTAEDRLLAVSTLSFDIAALELCLPLFSGAGIVIASRDMVLDPARLSQAIDARQITAMQATPSTWRMLVDHGWQPRNDFLLISTGEALPRDLAEQLLQSVPSLTNLYGPTETTMYSTIARVQRSEHGVRIDIGRPVANTQTHILDEEMELVPLGVAGELFIAGDGVARGYRGRPDLTAERFIPNPYGEPGARMYRTGDLVRWLPHGELEYLGRIDQQVKLRGFRIELGEIEASLRALPQIRDAAVMVREDQPGNKRLVGYVVATEANEETGTQALRQALSKTLPDYMVPSQIMWLPALPLTPNGKTDRRALPVPDAITSEADYVAPRTETEQALSEIWADVLKVERVGIHDNFFELGGHSLQLVRVHQQLVLLTSRPVSMIDLFQYPTISQLVSLLHTEVDDEKSQIKTQVDASARRGEQRRRRHASVPVRAKSDATFNAK